MTPCCAKNGNLCATTMWWLAAQKKTHDLFGNDVFPNLNQVFTESLKNVSSHVESSVCHGEIWFHTMHVTQRYQRHTVIQPWQATWTIFFLSRCAGKIYTQWGEFWILRGDFLVVVCHAVRWLMVLRGMKRRTLVQLAIQTPVRDATIKLRHSTLHLAVVVRWLPQPVRPLQKTSVHQWIRSASRDLQRGTSLMGFLYLKISPLRCAMLLIFFVSVSCLVLENQQIELPFFYFRTMDILDYGFIIQHKIVGWFKLMIIWNQRFQVNNPGFHCQTRLEHFLQVVWIAMLLKFAKTERALYTTAVYVQELNCNKIIWKKCKMSPVKKTQ